MSIYGIDALVGKASAQSRAKKDAEAAVDAKVGQAATAAPVVGTAAAVVKSAQEEDGVQLTADALKLSSETLAKGTAAAPGLSAGGQIITGINKAAQGDAFGAASAAQAAVEKVAPALAKSGVGAVASVVLLGAGNDKVAEQAQVIKASAKKLVSDRTSGAQKAKAAFDLSIGVQNYAGLARTLGNAAVNLGGYGVKLMGKSAELAPAAAKLTRAATAVARSPVGKLGGFLNKWIPLLNVAGVALSAKTAIDVFKSRRASGQTKALAVASLATAGLGLWAGFALPGMAFLGIVGASIGIDMWLAKSRVRDAAKPLGTWSARRPLT